MSKQVVKGMTVAELRKVLEDLPGNLQIVLEFGGSFDPLHPSQVFVTSEDELENSSNELTRLIKVKSGKGNRLVIDISKTLPTAGDDPEEEEEDEDEVYTSESLQRLTVLRTRNLAKSLGVKVTGKTMDDLRVEILEKQKERAV